LFSPEHPGMRITKISTSKPEFIQVKQIALTPKESEQLKTKGGYRLDIEIKPGMALGNFRDQVVLETDHPDQPKVELTLAGSVNGPISVMPANLSMISVNGKEGSSGQVTMLVRGQHACNFKVIHKPENVDVSIEPNETPTLKGRYRLTVTVPPGTSAGQVNDQIILQTDHPSARELKIPVNIVIGAS
jgi:uncharacterized membrane protein